MNRKKIIISLAAVIALIFVFMVSAHAETKLEVGIPGMPKQTVSGPVEYIKYIYLFTLGFVGIAGFITLVMWGAVWTASSVIDKKARAIEGIKNALTGIAIAFTAFILLNTINPDLTIIKAPPIGKVETRQTTFTPVVDPWVTARREWFCRLNQPNLHDFELASRSEPGCENPPSSMNCANGEVPLCFIEIPKSALQPFWNCGNTTSPISSRWAISADQVPCRTLTKPYCSGLPLVCYSTN